MPPAHRLSFTLSLLIVLFVGCAHQPIKPVTGYSPDVGETAAKTALSMVGRPYKFQGDSPEGFDCSGLVQYSYLEAGLDAPHGTKALMPRTSPINGKLQTGDLLFFNERGKTYSHVGIYLENDTFVHAPGTGGKVRKDSLQDPYWKDHFIEARRFL